MSRLLASASSSRFASAAASCSCAASARLASTSVKAPASTEGTSSTTAKTKTTRASLPPVLPLHRHANSLDKKPLQQDRSQPGSALSLLASQPAHYITALLLNRRYTLTPSDVVTVPHMKNVRPGDRIQLTRILEVGSRDYTLRAAATAAASSATTTTPTTAPLMARQPRLDENGVLRDWQRHPDSLPYLNSDVVNAELTVLEHTKGKMFQVEKFKRRKGYRRTLRSKLGFTKLRMGPIVLGSGGSDGP